MEWLGPWFAPFVVLLMVLYLYFIAARGTRESMRQVMRQDINFYIVAILSTAIVATFAGYRIERDWLDVAAWLVAAVAIAACLWRFMAGSSVVAKSDKDDRGPLERND